MVLKKGFYSVNVSNLNEINLAKFLHCKQLRFVLHKNFKNKMIEKKPVLFLITNRKLKFAVRFKLFVNDDTFLLVNFF